MRRRALRRRLFWVGVILALLLLALAGWMLRPARGRRPELAFEND
jgi:hypothetical protein